MGRRTPNSSRVGNLVTVGAYLLDDVHALPYGLPVAAHLLEELGPKERDRVVGLGGHSPLARTVDVVVLRHERCTVLGL